MKEFPSLVSLLTVASDTETLWLPRTVCVRPGAEPSQGVGLRPCRWTELPGLHTCFE